MKGEESTVSWRRHAQALQILAAVLLMAYSNSFGTGFTSDSQPMILGDARVHSITRQHLADILFHNYAWPGFRSGLYRPISTLSYLFNFVILDSAGSPAGYHWVNYLLHTANAFLVYLLVLRLVRQYWPALFAALLWELHPIVTEAVTYIVGRPEELAAFGVLAGLLFFMRAEEESGRCKLPWLAGAMAAATIAVFSKEGGVVVLPLAALYDFTFRTRRGAALLVSASLRSRLGAMAVDYAALALPVLAMLCARWLVLSRESAMQIPYVDNPILGAGFLAGRLTAIGVIGKYAWLLLWPRTLSADYSYNAIPPVDWPAIATLAGFLILAAICCRRSRTGLFLLGFSALALLPASNLLVITGTIMAERLLYLPSVGFAAAIAIGAYSLAGRLHLRPLAALALTAIGAAYAARTYERNPDWQDNQTLFRKAEETNPASFKPHFILATTALDRDPKLLNGDSAIAEAETAEMIVSGLPDQWKPAAVPWVRGTLYYTRAESLCPQDADGNPHPDAISEPWYRKALAADLEAVRLDHAEAEAYRRREMARGRKPEDIPPAGPHELYAGLGRIYLRLGDPQPALEAFLYERRLAPNVADVYAHISSADTALHKSQDAAAEMLESYILDGSGRSLRQTLELYRKADPGGCEAGHDVDGVTLNRQCPAVRRDFCRAYRDLEQGVRERGIPGQAERFHAAASQVPGCR